MNELQRRTIEAAAAAIANARGMRHGAPPISNILELLRGMQTGGKSSIYDDVIADATAAIEAVASVPLPLVIHCPKCRLQHVDVDDDTGKWATTRHHRKHLCKPSGGGCGHVWLVANVPTVGVAQLMEFPS
jgi:hypothetical protein